MNMHEPPESYKRGPGSGLACQLKLSSRRGQTFACIPMGVLYQHCQHW